ncbi:AraC family transcriptional regulator [Flavicella sediminum]|uniref:AraC family transcriptional regulator n=1 Tax=Flavicella sediminum TaxID=2585141 RepID=UPI00112336DE|nr:AraC family transcriptional regulator [Flavicella sediminum]
MKAEYEKIPLSTESSFHTFVYKNEGFEAPWHFHPEYELTFIVKGKGMRYVGNSVQQFEEGDLVLLGSNLPHCWKENAEENSGDVESIVFQWDDKILGEGWLQKKEFSRIKYLLEKSARGVLFKQELAFRIAALMLEIMQKPAFERMMGFLNLLQGLAAIDTTECLVAEGFTPNLNSKSHKRIESVYSFVHENYSQKIKLSEVSSLVSMGDEAFCRFFKKNLNKSFFTFVNEYRINRVCRMLIETNKQVNQIAYECGYESLPFFYRQFDKFMNCSPLNFKKEHFRIRG